jgi:hypothetical protein
VQLKTASYEYVDDAVVDRGTRRSWQGCQRNRPFLLISFPVSFPERKKAYSMYSSWKRKVSLFISCPLLADVAYPLHEIRGLSNKKCSLVDWKKN